MNENEMKDMQTNHKSHVARIIYMHEIQKQNEAITSI